MFQDKPNDLISSLIKTCNENEEKRLQKASESADGISYYNCNALSKVEELAEELSKLSESELSAALKIIVRMTKELKQKKV
jgi:hypothetical protein